MRVAALQPVRGQSGCRQWQNQAAGEFFRPFYGDFWVLALPENYRWVLAGEPSRQYRWVLSSPPPMAPAHCEATLARAEVLGYARSAFRLTPQRQALP